jgi:hypothetical protein
MPSSPADRLRDVLLTFLNGERSGMKEISVRLSASEAECGGPGVTTLRRVLEDRAGGLGQQTFHLEYDNTRLRECTVLPDQAADVLSLGFASQEPIDDY